MTAERASHFIASVRLPVLQTLFLFLPSKPHLLYNKANPFERRCSCLRFLHLSDLHLGKRVCEFSMLEDQRYILEEILSLLDQTPVDGVLLAGWVPAGPNQRRCGPPSRGCR